MVNGLPCGTVVKYPPANAGDARDWGSIAGSGRSPGVGNGNLLQYACLDNSMDRGAHGLQSMGSQKSWTLWATEHAHTHAHTHTHTLGEKWLVISLRLWQRLFFRTACDIFTHFPQETLGVSDSLWPHGLLLARLLCSWNFPGKNPGAGCHFLLQGIFLTQRLNPSLLHLLH